jgi:DnaJ-class molecular chaperone
MIDYYKCLNVQSNCTYEDIKRSYHTLAKQYHPDKYKGSDQNFVNIKEAYDTLSNPDTRKQYDQTRPSTYDPWIQLATQIFDISLTCFLSEIKSNR